MKSKVFIQQAILPPYRLAFFQALSASSQLDITMAYGESQESSALKSLQGPKGVRHLPVLNRAIGKGPTALWQSGILDLFKRENPDVLIQSLDPRILSNWRLARLARRMGKKVIVWGHGIRPSGRFRNLYAKIATSADAVILYSGHGKRGLAEVGVPDSNMFVAWNSIDTRTISGLRASTPLEDRTDVLYIGRMIADKKILLLLEAFALALPQLPSRVQLALLGGGPMVEELKNLSLQLGISERTRFVGETYSEPEVALQMNRSWVSVSPGYVGLSAIHSLAYGVPMLVAREEPHSPEVEALIEGENALFFPSDDAGALARMLETLSSDAGRFGQMSAKAIQKSEEFSVESMVASFEAAVRHAVHR